MLLKVAGFEFRYQLRQPIFWVAAIILFLLSFSVIGTDNVQVGGIGNVKKNSPYALAFMTMIFTIIYMFVTTAFVANVVVRDDDSGFGPIIKATRLDKFDYLFGRFLGATAVACIGFIFVYLGVFFGTLMPWVNPEVIGPNQITSYAWPYFVLAVPNIIITGAIFFAVATATRSMMFSYMGVIAFLVVYIALTITFDKPQYEEMVAFGEPLGMGAFQKVTQYWTAAERNAGPPPLASLILWNRLLWLGLSALVLGLAFALYRMEQRGSSLNRAQKLKALAERTPDVAALPQGGALPRPAFTGRTARAQMWSRTRIDMAQVFLSPAYLVLMVIGLANTVAGLWDPGSLFGTPLYPVTRIMIEGLEGAFGVIIPIMIAAFYAGELVWRERDRRTHEIIDAAPVPDWAFVFPKVLAIALVLVSSLLVSIVASVAIQALRGWTEFELDKYLVWYLMPAVVRALSVAVLAVFFQVVSPHKFVGWLLMLGYLIFNLIANQLGLDHPLYRYGAGIAMPTSDMNGLGDFWKGWAWLKLYWGAFAVILVILSYALWQRGTETRMTPRLRRLPGRLKGPAAAVAAVCLAVFVASGAYIYVNTNVWNDYLNVDGRDRRAADFEKGFLKYEKLPQLSTTAVRLNLDLFPREPRLDVVGAYDLVNRTPGPISELHLRLDPDAKWVSAAAPGATLLRDWPRFNYRIYRFARPLQPGEKVTLSFRTRVAQKGFKVSNNLFTVADNGSFINNYQFAPVIGMGRDSLLQSRAKRHKYGLPPELRIPKLEDDTARARNYLANADWVNADIRLTTDADQTPIAPGYRVSDVTSGGRRTARFVTEAPVIHFFSAQSARYAVRRRDHKGVEVAVYYHPSHARNVDRMLTALEQGLDYYSANFSPYQFRQVRIIEFPAYAQFAQSFPNTFPWSESLGFIADNSDKQKIDYVSYVAAHELGHQWWAHQLLGAEMQGETMLSETLAQYSALMVMERMYGPDLIRKFLKYELDRYLRSRSADVVEEVPLVRVENQPYIHYNKGSLVMYRLKEEIGEAAVNRALSKILARYAFKGAPFASSKDLVALFRAEAPADKQQLITDLFEKITVYDVKTTGAKVRRLSDGRFETTVSAETHKFYVDGKGKETEAPMGDVVDVGLFAVKPDEKGFGRDKVLQLVRTPVRTGAQSFTFITRVRPTWVGVDPYNKLIDRKSDDNLKETPK